MTDRALNVSVVETTRLRILPFSEQHLTPKYVSWLNDPIATRYSEQRRRNHTMETCRAYWESFAGTPHHFWAIETIDPDPGHIGNMNAYIEIEDGVADLGILIGERSVWGKGYGTEAWTAVCRHLLETKGIRKVSAGCLAVNEAMVRLMERAGMVDDGVRMRHKIWEGKTVDIIHKALFRP